MKPFRDGSISSVSEAHLKQVTNEIKNLEAHYVRSVSKDELLKHYIAAAEIDPIILHVDDKYIVEHTNTNIDVSHDFRRSFPGERTIIRGSRITIAIPYDGDRNLWRVRASRYGIGGFPNLDVSANEIRFSLDFPDDEANSSQLKTQIDEIVNSLFAAIANLHADVEKHNAMVPERVAQTIDLRLRDANATTSAIESLGIPMKRSAKPAYTIPTKRRSRPTRPSPKASNQKPEPILDEREYQHILTVLKSMALVIERNPKTFAGLNEESIRDHFLLQLNGQYEGMASGETFNAAGKTDILIRENDRNVFVAECKFWSGPKGFNEAIDQLLSYLTWRDCKCALLIFNRNKNTTAVWERMHIAMESRNEHAKTIAHGDIENTSRYVFRKPGDDGRELIISTQVFDVPKSNI